MKSWAHPRSPGPEPGSRLALCEQNHSTALAPLSAVCNKELLNPFKFKLARWILWLTLALSDQLRVSSPYSTLTFRKMRERELLLYLHSCLIPGIARLVQPSPSNPCHGPRDAAEEAKCMGLLVGGKTCSLEQKGILYLNDYQYFEIFIYFIYIYLNKQF